MSDGRYSIRSDFADLARGTGDATVAVNCFAAGSRIRTDRGDVRVENLRPGDIATVLSGSQRPIIWIGYRHIDCRHHAAPHLVLPIRIRAGAFGAGHPERDLLLSPNHAVFVDGVLVPIHYLINGTSIRRALVQQVTYYHVELEQHDVLVAEGLPVESYLDSGDRCNFSNGGDVIALHPDFTTDMWEVRSCARLVTGGQALETIRARLNHRGQQRRTRRGAVGAQERLVPS